MLFKKEYINTPSRAKFGLQIFKKYFVGRILDIGAGGSADFFRTQFDGQYVAVDVSKDRNVPNVEFNFEKGPLPFKDNEFETVLCFDCLEHCDNIHQLFDELVRVSSRYIIISLPNNWPRFLNNLWYGHHFTHMEGYGLPGNPPFPGARHKWWFNIEEAENFVSHRAKLTGAHVLEKKYIYEPGDHFIYLSQIYPKIFGADPRQIRAFLGVGPQEAQQKGRLAYLAYRLANKLGHRFSYGLFLVLRYGIGTPLFLVDEFFKRLIWGWGSKYRYLNLFCRQFWVVLEKK